MLETFKDINIHTLKEFTFRGLFYQRHRLEIAKYLYEYSIQQSKKKWRAPHDKIIDIHVLNDAPLRNAVKGCNIEGCKWLLSIGANKEVMRIEILKIINHSNVRYLPQLKNMKQFCKYICEEFPEFKSFL